MLGNSTPSEGGRGAVEGKMRLQAALGAVVPLRTLGRWDENAGKQHTFGRWRGVVEGETRLQVILVAVQLLLTFGRWDENAGKQHTFGRWNENDEWKCDSRGPCTT